MNKSKFLTLNEFIKTKEYKKLSGYKLVDFDNAIKIDSAFSNEFFLQIEITENNNYIYNQILKADNKICLSKIWGKKNMFELYFNFSKEFKNVTNDTIKRAKQSFDMPNYIGSPTVKKVNEWIMYISNVSEYLAAENKKNIDRLKLNLLELKKLKAKEHETNEYFCFSINKGFFNYYFKLDKVTGYAYEEVTIELRKKDIVKSELKINLI